MTHLPQEGRRIGIVGKGGSGKSTTWAHVLAYYGSIGVPAIGQDADEPGENEKGSLLAWSDKVNIGAPVYRAPAASGIGAEARRLTPPHGVCLIDTGAWERRSGNTHFSVLANVDLCVFALPPTPMEMERAGSVMKAFKQMRDFGLTPPRTVFLLTLVNPNANTASIGETRDDLTDAGFHVLTTTIPRKDGRGSYAQSFGTIPDVRPGSPMARLGDELLREVAL
jgi:hypothetical protein